MNYVETNRTVEPHSECILLVYLQDANGAPVPDIKLKIYAGPPPTGLPPYFTDDDPNNPNRRTDASGRFQFIVANPTSPNNLDFFVQVLGADTEPQSQPIHFPFPANTSQWVIVTLAPEGAKPGGVGSSPLPAPALQLDPRLASDVGVSVQFAQPASGASYWKLIAAQYQDETQSGGNVNIVCFVQNEQGLALSGGRVIQKWPGDQASGTTDERGHIDFPMTADSSFSPERGEHGPYSTFVDGLPSDTVIGMGLPLRRHVQYVLTWRRVAAGAPVSQPPPASGSLRGRITNAPAGAQASLSAVHGASGSLMLTAPLAADGSYGFANLPAGTYSLALTGSGVLNPDLVLDGAQAVTFDYAVPPQAAQKPFIHYLLFGPGSQPGTLTNLILALDYIIRYAPACGFDVGEALNASHVTIVGDTSAVSAADEQRLREAGCQVARLTASDSYALENLLKQLIASGSPYPAA